MSLAARKRKPKPAPVIFHATMLVTRAEEWWVEAATIDEARALLAAGDGHCAAAGASVHVELEEVSAGDDG